MLTYNIAEYGGGLFDTNESNPIIRRCVFSENLVWFGGGGGIYNASGTIGSGGAGGGGAGARGSGAATAGTVNTGGGGGATGVGGTGATGGKGVVILSMPTASYSALISGSPTVTTSGANTILTFTGSGTYSG